MNLTPNVAQARWSALGASHNARLRRAATEQLCSPRWQTSLPTRLRCVICAVAHVVSCGAKLIKSFLHRQKREMPSIKRRLVFLALQEQGTI